MRSSSKLLLLVTLASFVYGCAATPPVKTAPAPVGDTAQPGTCDVSQSTLLQEADRRAAPYSLQQHLTKNFADRRVSWLMKDGAYQSYVVKTNAKRFGRCNDAGCFLFVAPASVIHDAVTASMKDGRHDAAALGKALGLPATNFEGTLRMMTLDLNAAAACVRLPVESDPGVWKCQSAEDRDCFKFGGYTSGGVPELMVINAPVEKTQVEEVP